METRSSDAWEPALRRAVLAGDEGAWRALYERSFPVVHVFVHRRTGGDVHRTEEILQESWLTAVRRIRSFDPSRGSFERWVVGIAANVLRNRWRRESRRGTERTLPPEGLPVEPRETLALEGAEQFAMAMSALPDRYRNVLRAKYEQELTVVEIARQREETPKAVESLLSRARTAFRDAYRRLDA